VTKHPSEGKVVNITMRDKGGKPAFVVTLVNVRVDDIYYSPIIPNALSKRYPGYVCSKDDIKQLHIGHLIPLT